MARGKTWRVVGMLALVGLVFSTTGCGYLKNLRDDALDIGMWSHGIVPPVVPTADGPKAVGFVPPAIGVYMQATDLFHLGALYKFTGDLEWDRRSLGVVFDKRAKFGLGPFHYVSIEQCPVCTTGHKDPESDLEGWRQHMLDLKDPLFHSPAKVMIFEPRPEYDDEYYIAGVSDPRPSRYLAHGWQDWGLISFEIAFPEPFLLHSGFYGRIGVDPSQILDFMLGFVGVDLYSDAAYTFMGDLKR
ncbi:MAG: hypothetical protein GXY85_04080 [Candidatus Brocadiaceae bacterium]|nr:hypothetical protein [Candidatus Brocadiaceae bacterium]